MVDANGALVSVLREADLMEKQARPATDEAIKHTVDAVIDGVMRVDADRLGDHEDDVAPVAMPFP